MTTPDRSVITDLVKLYEHLAEHPAEIDAYMSSRHAFLTDTSLSQEDVHRAWFDMRRANYRFALKESPQVSFAGETNLDCFYIGDAKNAGGQAPTVDDIVTGRVQAPSLRATYSDGSRFMYAAAIVGQLTIPTGDPTPADPPSLEFYLRTTVRDESALDCGVVHSVHISEDEDSPGDKLRLSGQAAIIGPELKVDLTPADPLFRGLPKYGVLLSGYIAVEGPEPDQQIGSLALEFSEPVTLPGRARVTSLGAQDETGLYYYLGKHPNEARVFTWDRHAFLAQTGLAPDDRHRASFDASQANFQIVGTGCTAEGDLPNVTIAGDTANARARYSDGSEELDSEDRPENVMKVCAELDFTSGEPVTSLEITNTGSNDLPLVKDTCYAVTLANPQDARVVEESTETRRAAIVIGPNAEVTLSPATPGGPVVLTGYVRYYEEEGAGKADLLLSLAQRK
jgi:hypothetical protein